MNGETFSLEALRVAKPCGESWEEMSGTDEARFCSHCRKSVHDLSQLTRAQAEALVARSRGGVCLRVARRPDGRVAVKEKPSAFARARRSLSFAASAALAALLGLITDARAQTKSTYKSKSCPDASVAVSRTRGEGVSAQAAHASLSGTVTDPLGAVVPGVRVSLRKRERPAGKDATRKDEKAVRVKEATEPTSAVPPAAVATTDDEGAFKLGAVERGVYTLVVEAVGFKRVEVENVAVGDGEDVRLDVALPPDSVTVTVGIVVLPEFPNPHNNLAMPIDKVPLHGIGRPEE